MAQKLGTTRAKIAFIETNKTLNPSIGDIVNFSNLFSISIDVLLKIDLSKLSEIELLRLEKEYNAYITGGKIRILATTVDKENNENIELVPEKAKAGYRTGYADPEFIASLPRYTVPGLSKHRKYRIFPITGDSMLPYPDSCYIVSEYVEDWLTLKDDTLCILILKSQGPDFVFKQVVNLITRNKTLLAKSLNVHYHPYEIPVEEIIEIWKYTAHIANTIAIPPDISIEYLANVMQEIKIDIAKLIVDKHKRA